MRVRGLLLALCAVLSLAACREETKEIAVTKDISSWPQYCLGYHLFRAPPDLVLTDASAAIDENVIAVVPGAQGGRLDDILTAQPDVGRTLHQAQVNGWEIRVTTRHNGLVESSTRLNLLAAQRVGGRVVVTSRVFSRRLWDEAGNPELWAWHAVTRPLPDAAPGSPGTYCIDDIVFSSERPPRNTRFSVDFGLPAEGSRPDNPLMRSDVSLGLMALHYPEGSDGDDRPLAPAQDISEMPGVSVTSEKLSIMGRDTGFSTAEMSVGGKTRLAFDALVFGEGETPDDPRSISLSFTDARLAPDEARETALAILSSLQSQR